MMNAIVQAWQERFVRNGPHLTCLLLGILIFAECLRMALPLMSRHSSIEPRVQSAVTNSQQHRSSGLDVRTIAAAHLFGVVTEDSRDADAASPAAANLILEGIIATRDPKGGVAILTADGPARVYQVGDAVGGASLDSVYLDHVLLDRNGSLEVLSLPRSTLSVGSTRSLPVDSDRSGETGHGHSLSDLLRAEPSLDDESGSVRGFRIRPGKIPSAFVRSGLRPGDLVTEVNGTPLADQDRQRSQAIVDTMLASNHATVLVLRNGIPTEVTVESPP